ncbi:hypothetical protein KUCAC02_004675, partial [Chaenocephalus aceratus]
MRLGSLLRKWCRNQEPAVLPDQTKGWLGPCHQVSINPQSSHQQGKPDFQVFHPHLLDCCPLTCANMKERDGEKDRKEGPWAVALSQTTDHRQ